jgi:hypothetical protein
MRDGEILDVAALVAVLGDFLSRAPGADRGASRSTWAARVVEYTYVLHALTSSAAEREDACQRVAEGGVAPPAARQRPVGMAETNSTLTWRRPRARRAHRRRARARTCAVAATYQAVSAREEDVESTPACTRRDQARATARLERGRSSFSAIARGLP